MKKLSLYVLLILLFYGNAIAQSKDRDFKLNQLFNQLKELLKTKTLRDLADVRGANIGVSTTDESLPIIFDY